jgi:hypothetical protein
MSFADPSFAIPLMALIVAGAMWLVGFDQGSPIALISRRLLQAVAAGSLTYHIAVMVVFRSLHLGEPAALRSAVYRVHSHCT